MATFIKRIGPRGVKWTARVRRIGCRANKTFPTKVLAKEWAFSKEAALNSFVFDQVKNNHRLAVKKHGAAQEKLNRVLEQTATLKKQTAALNQKWIMHAMTATKLLPEDEIVAASDKWITPSGIYFLVRGKRVVYTGQSVNVLTRIAEHSERIKFDRCAFIECPRSALDVLESLYIHALKPKENGRRGSGEIIAPLKLQDCIPTS
jgi:hypothetical protein